MWFDISPRDGFGRYTALGLISLISGLGLSRLVGIEFITQFPDPLAGISILGYIILFLASIAVLPLAQMDNTYPPLKFLLLMVRMEGGILLYYNEFKNKLFEHDKLALVSGGLEAIDTFMHEVLQHGNIHGNMEHVLHAGFFILNAQQKDVRANLIVNHSSLELRQRLNLFVTKFHEQNQTLLTNWDGNIDTFQDTDELVEIIFGPLFASSDLV
jgi:hypothetical protein